ncbi:mismatch-specific DNA-glycosylase [Deinococcus radiophilus]|uniref:mismatch-specific DNA-glycosylase n=1 Tax=Deinococcus radiophilus TaxID=32062 RepID=UPI001E4ACB84|nr:mismatch-specific DNA-glycosylase [Deinococcus radiophilus]UFA50874.1 mismatch-specific DNA-glycosylase [Deinococcus radiophilus]
MTKSDAPGSDAPKRTPEGYFVPDVLAEGLTLVLVGTAPSRRSAAARAYYANPQNKFWRTLHAVGLTPRQLAPAEFPLLPEYGIGLTDVAKRHNGVDAALPSDAWAPGELREKLRRYSPRIVAFTSKRGASETLGLPTGRLPYGKQLMDLEGAELWVLPSTSPLGHNHFSLEPWQALADRVRELRVRENR